LCNIWNKVETYILWTSVSIDCTSQLKETQELHAFLGWMPRFYTSAQDSIHHNPLILQIYTNVLLPIWTVCIKQDFPLLSLLLTSVPFSPFTKCNRCRYNTVYPTTFCWCNTIQQEQIAGTFLIGYYQTMANKNRSKNQFHQQRLHCVNGLNKVLLWTVRKRHKLIQKFHETDKRASNAVGRQFGLHI